jgi:ornithine cyclodeaminase
VLYESTHRRPVAIMEASALTAIRTAAASVVATQALARPDSRTLAIIGTGEEARFAPRCLPGRAAIRACRRVGTQS